MQSERIKKISEGFNEVFRLEPTHLFSSPGRMEIIGNHTDHNHGYALAAAIDLDILSAVSPNDEFVIRAMTEGFDYVIEIDLNDLIYRPEEIGTSASLIRGVAYRLVSKGYKIGGLNLYMNSIIPRGAGVSSSAAYELLFAKVLSVIYNDDKIDQYTLAEAGQYAEVNYFGKGSGLLDQIAVSYGAVSLIDFNDPSKPKVETLDFSLEHFDIILINTGGSHGKLSDLYTQIPADMKEVARYFNKEYLRDVPYQTFLKVQPQIYRELGGRPLLRAQHFFDENERVIKATAAIKGNSEKDFVQLIANSGLSSFNLLQNYTFPDDKEERLYFAYNWARSNFRRGAYRVHGGGFAGTMLAIVPKPVSNLFIKEGEAYFGKRNLFKVNIRHEGTCLIKDGKY